MTPGPTADQPTKDATVRFSIVSAAHNVSRYLPEFIESIEAQSFPLERLEVIVVDDGSEDDSLVVLKDWAARRPELVKVFAQDNGGVGSARNLGLEHARGEWITFADPDDTLDPEYFACVEEFLRANADAVMIATNRRIFNEQSGRLLNHPLRRMHSASDRVVDLARFPDTFVDSASNTFFDAAQLRRTGQRFEPRLRPTFEGADFCVRYLMAAPSRIVGVLRSAQYLQRRRNDGLASMQANLRNPERFLTVPRVGPLALLTEFAGPDGYAAEWVQNLVLYELSSYFRPEQTTAGLATAIRGEVADQFVQALREIADRLDPAIVQSYRLSRFDQVWREILLHGLSGERWVTPYAVSRKFDPVQKQVQIAYRFTGARPHEDLLASGRALEVQHGKVRVYEFFDRPLMYERLAWIPANRTLRVILDGKATEVLPAWPEPSLTSVRPAQLATWFDEANGVVPKPRKLKFRQRALGRVARSLPVRLLFRNSWMLIDKVHESNDNAERLFQYLRAERPRINAWFVLEKGSPDWVRMSKEGHKRMIPYGSNRWRLLMLNCKQVISSQADQSVLRPPTVARHRPAGDWKFSFIQHGVIKSDLSRWLNNQDFDLLVTSTPQEKESIAGDSPYGFTSKEVQMTGLPRFDRLLRLGAQVPPAERDVIMVCPTWRHWLNLPKDPGTHRRVVTGDFLESDYARNWLGFLGDERLREFTEKHGLRVVFLPHPNIQPALASLKLPPHVEAMSYAGTDVQQVIARSVLMVTDYSSITFDSAYLERPVVYFQFDADRVLDGGHNGRPGYYDHDAHGFGPVTESVADAVAAVEKIVTVDGRVPTPEFQRRIEEAFPERDGRCCERTTAAIEQLTRQLRKPVTVFRD